MPSAIELFAGCGGLSTGLENAGFNILSAVEINSVAANSYRANHPNVDVIVEDVHNVTAARLLRQNNLRRGELDLLAGCSPCQGFSRLRKGASGDTDPRNQLVFEFLRLVKGLYPKTIFMENVPGIINTKYGLEIFSKVLNELNQLGYNVDYSIIDTANYGVPQFRRRFVLLGSRYKRHAIQIPLATNCAPSKVAETGLQPWQTVRQAFQGIPPLNNGATDINNPLHKCSNNNKLNLERIQAIPHDGGSRTSLPEKLVLNCHKKYPNGFKDVYGRMKWDSPSPTLTGGCTNITKGRFIHPDQDRGISLYEASKLQSFPDNYIFKGNMGEIALQIGNAVPVELAYRMGRQIFNCIEQINGHA